ncbi:unnamed protein product [Rodentolepis nana]|uniref:Myb-like domain-containing protein n=1 Tax=Rodentolepis nana TaxID=102285 RepID=A0A0R3TYP0_RODNA|nr:unnamed protein product [Rodentolepis nana]
MKALIRREFQTSKCNEIKARTKEKQWTVALSDIPDWPRIEAVAEFRLRTGHDCLAKHLYRLGVYTQPTCPRFVNGASESDYSFTMVIDDGGDDDACGGGGGGAVVVGAHNLEQHSIFSNDFSFSKIII